MFGEEEDANCEKNSRAFVPTTARFSRECLEQNLAGKMLNAFSAVYARLKECSKNDGTKYSLSSRPFFVLRQYGGGNNGGGTGD